jgi:AraC-like DNA-binding protein
MNTLCQKKDILRHMFAHMPIIRDILYGAASRGASLNDLCLKLPISVEELSDSEKSVDFEKAYRAWELAVSSTHDHLLGLHLGETATPSILGLIGHLMQSSPDLLTAYQQVCKHAALATDMFIYSIESTEDQTLLKYEPARLWLNISETSARQAVEQAMAGTLNVFYLLSGKRVSPIHTQFSFGKPKSRTEYERVFGSVTFAKKENTLLFKTADLTNKITSYDRSLFSLFNKIIQEKLEKLARKNSLSDQIKRILTQEFKGQIISAGTLATHLNMSVRTFQRKLNEEGTTYRELSLNLRKELAILLLKKQGSSVRDVARMLGYSEASALRKALNSD